MTRNGLAGFSFDTIAAFNAKSEGEKGTFLESVVHDEFNHWRIVNNLAVLPEGRVRDVTSASELQAWLTELTDRAKPINQEYPLVIINAHGNEAHGLRFPDGSWLSWQVLFDSLATLNTATRMNLFVILGSCFGAEISRKLQVGSRAPYHGLLAPTEEISSDNLTQDVVTFMKTSLDTIDPAKGVLAMFNARPESSSQWQFHIAEDLFARAWGYWRTEHFSRRRRDETVNRLLTQSKALGVLPGDSLNSSRKLIKNDMPSAAAKVAYRAWRQFFMVDIAPENAQRFPFELESWTEGALSPVWNGEDLAGAELRSTTGQ